MNNEHQILGAKQLSFPPTEEKKSFYMSSNYSFILSLVKLLFPATLYLALFSSLCNKSKLMYQHLTTPPLAPPPPKSENPENLHILRLMGKSQVYYYTYILKKCPVNISIALFTFGLHSKIVKSMYVRCFIQGSLLF